MKRLTLVLPEELLHEAVLLSGERTYSKTVERALEVFVRRARAQQIREFRSSDLWRGDLSEMRDDSERE